MATPVVQLTASSGGQTLATFDLIPGDYPIGRDPACSIHLASPDVSRKHAQLTVTPEGCAIEDIGGRYGTFIDNRQISGKIRVQPGQTITLGRTTLELTLLENTPATEPTTDPHTQRYEISRQLAKGGMGEVYLALDHQLQRHVALKVMTPEIAANPDLSTRFTQEALVLGRLDHPHIVPIHDLGVDAQGRNYYAMKFVRGTTLKEVLHGLRKGQSTTVDRYPLARLLDIFGKTCDAVAYAHSKGIIHRDLKPANIMIGEFGEVLVMDWGIAKILSQTEKAPDSYPPTGTTEGTRYGTVMGTPSFMAPEQAEGRLDAINERTDIYSLGAILYNILALRPPITGSSADAEVMERIKTGRITPPTQRAQNSRDTNVLLHCPDHQVPEALSAVAMQALALEPRGRYADVHSLQRDVSAYTAGYAPAAEHAGFFRQIRLSLRRHATLAAAWSVIILLVLGFALHTHHATKEQEETLAQFKSAAPGSHALAGKLMARGLFPDALAPAQLATELDPQQPEHWQRLARVQFALHRPSAASEAIRQAEKLDEANKFTAQAEPFCNKLAQTYGSGSLPLHALGSVYHWQLRRGMSLEARYTLSRIAAEKTNSWNSAQAALRQLGLPGRASRDEHGYLKINLGSSKIKDLTPFTRLPIYSMNLWQTQVKELKALRMMPLRQLSLAYTAVTDLSPLQGRPLQSLTIAYSPVENLDSLKGAPLVHLHLSGTRARDLSALHKMPLQTLHLDSTPVRDLSALAGLPLRELRLDGCTELRDLTPLAKCTDLEVLTLPREHGEIDFLRNLPKLKKLSYRYDTDSSKLEPASQFWRTRSLARQR